MLSSHQVRLLRRYAAAGDGMCLPCNPPVLRQYLIWGDDITDLTTLRDHGLIVVRRQDSDRGWYGIGVTDLGKVVARLTQ